MTETSTKPAETAVAVVSPATLALFAQMAVGIPEATDEDAYENIVLQLLSAGDAAELNAPWDTTDAARLEGHRLRIESLQRRPTDYAGGLGLYLVLKGTDMESGEKFVWSTGAVSVVAQMARAWHLGGFPVIARLVIAENTTANGFRPQHLEILAFGGSK